MSYRRFFAVWIPVDPFAMRFAVAIAAYHLFLTVEMPQGQRTIMAHDQASRISAAYPDGRPTKRDRRQLDRMKRDSW